MEVDAGQLVMIASLADEQDGAVPFDLDDGAVAEFHHLANPRVKLGERRLGPGHMVCCPRVEDPSPVLLLLTSFTDLSEHSLLLQLELAPQPVPLLCTIGTLPRVRRSPEQLCRRRLPLWIWGALPQD